MRIVHGMLVFYLVVAWTLAQCPCFSWMLRILFTKLHRCLAFAAESKLSLLQVNRILDHSIKLCFGDAVVGRMFVSAAADRLGFRSKLFIRSRGWLLGTIFVTILSLVKRYWCPYWWAFRVEGRALVKPPFLRVSKITLGQMRSSNKVVSTPSTVTVPAVLATLPMAVILVETLIELDGAGCSTKELIMCPELPYFLQKTEACWLVVTVWAGVRSCFSVFELLIPANRSYFCWSFRLMSCTITDAWLTGILSSDSFIKSEGYGSGNHCPFTCWFEPLDHDFHFRLQKFRAYA